MTESSFVLALTPTERTVIVDHIPLPPGITARLRFAVRAGASVEVSLSAEEFDIVTRGMIDALGETEDMALADVLTGILTRIKPLTPEDIPEEFDRSVFPEDIPDEVCQEIHSLLRSGEFETMDDAFEAVKELLNHHNEVPLDDLLGLTPDQGFRLLSSGWNAPGSVLRIRTDLAPEELRDSMYCRNARIMLQLLEDLGGIGLTPRKNIIRKGVRTIFEALDWPRYKFNHDRADTGGFNEERCTPVHYLRIFLEAAGLVRVYKKKLVVTKAGRRFLDPALASELQAALFIAMTTEFNLAYFDGAPDYPGVQDTYPFILYALSKVARQPVGVSTAYEAAYLPDVADEFMEFEYFSHKDFVFHTRVLQPLRDFGLVVWSPEILDHTDEDAERIMHTTPLFDRMIHFDFGAASPGSE